MDALNRQSRFRRTHVPPFKPVEGDWDILRCFSEFPLLTNEYLAALTGRPYGSVARRTNKMKNVYVKLHEAHINNPRQWKTSPLAMHLTPLGKGKLAEIGVPTDDLPAPHNHFAHQLGETELLISFSVGAAEKGLTLHTYPYGHGTMEDVSYTFNGEKHQNHVKPDGRPFAIEYPDGSYRFFPGFEFDKGTKPFSSSYDDRRSVDKQIAAQLTILEHKLYAKQFGVDSFVFLWTAVSPARLDGIKERFIQLTKERRIGNLLAAFAFKVVPTIDSALPMRGPTGYAITEPWQRIGHPPLDLSKGGD